METQTTTTTRTPPPPPNGKPAAGWTWETVPLEAQERYEEAGKERFRRVQVDVRRRTGPRHPSVPPVDPAYTFRAELLRELVWAVWPHDGGPWTPALFVGPKGSGKTSLVVQLAARCNVPVFRTNLHVGTTVRHLKGSKAAEAGRTVFVPGMATMAMEEGAWLVLDELAGATPPVALSLFPILEPDGAVLLEDEQPPRYVRRHPDFRVFGTDNTIGADQEATRFDYAGTTPEMNEALLDRFGCTVPVGYLPRELEFGMVQARVQGIDPDLLEGMIRVATNVREGRQMSSGFSTRMVLDWSRRVAAGRATTGGATVDRNTDRLVLDAAYPAFLNRMRSTTDRQAVVEVIRRLFALGG